MKRKILIADILILIMVFICSISIAYGADDTEYEAPKTMKTSAETQVMSGILTSSEKYGTLAKAEKFTAFGETVSSKGKVWYRIEYLDKEAYVSADTVKETTDIGYVIYSPSRTATVSGSYPVVRRDADSESEKLGTLSSGEKFSVKGYKEAANGTKWYRMTYSGKYGFISSKNTTLGDHLVYTIYTPAKDGKITAGEAEVRKSPKASAELLGKLPYDNYIHISGYREDTDGNKWYRIKYDGNAGYINSASVSTVSALSFTPYSPYKTGKITATNLPVRKTPSGDAESIGNVTKNELVTLKGKVSVNGSTWYRITYFGKAAYISGKSVSITDTLKYYTYNPQELGEVSVSSASVKSGVSSTSATRATYKRGKVITLKGYRYDSSGKKWYRITHSGKASYIKASSVKKLDYNPDDYIIKKVTIESQSYSVNIRAGAGTSYGIIGSMTPGSSAVYAGYKKDSSGTKWYKIEYGSGYGYVSSEYARIDSIAINDGAAFEGYLDQEGFPESYKPYLRTLHTMHPSWMFKVQKTGTSWNDAVSAETKTGRSLVLTQYQSWKSMNSGCYDWNSGRYVTYDSGDWVTAYSGLVKYYLDPRNFINDEYIFMFLDQKYDEGTQSADTVKQIVKGSFMEGTMPGTSSSWSYYINKAGKNAGVNPNVLASMIIQEQGWNGKSNLISGTYSGYEGYYNFFNVGAYRSGSMSAVERGLWYAKEAGWDTRYKAILGGAKFYASNYVKSNQNTLYLKKFNVANGNSNLGLHQYMTNVQGAASEAKHLKSGYKNLQDAPMVFVIPVYSSMPSSACKIPTTSGNNNCYLKSLKVKSEDKEKTYSMNKTFDRYTGSYTVTVPSSVDKIYVSYTKSDSGATVSGAGTQTLAAGTNTVKVKVKSTSGVTKTYTITIKRG